MSRSVPTGPGVLLSSLALTSPGWALRNCLALTSLGWAELTQGTELGFAGLGVNREQKKWSTIELALHFAGLGVF